MTVSHVTLRDFAPSHSLPSPVQTGFWNIGLWTGTADGLSRVIESRKTPPLAALERGTCRIRKLTKRDTPEVGCARLLGPWFP